MFMMVKKECIIHKTSVNKLIVGGAPILASTISNQLIIIRLEVEIILLLISKCRLEVE